MVIITANDAVQAAFRHIAQRAEIRDPAGTLIGYFEPSEETRKLYEDARKYFEQEDIKKSKSPVARIIRPPRLSPTFARLALSCNAIHGHLAQARSGCPCRSVDDRAESLFCNCRKQENRC
jgi:hypothetical protein